jgi:hypothetical protein
VTGWILPTPFIAFLALTHRLPVRNPPDAAPARNGMQPPVAAVAELAAATPSAGEQ